MAPRDAQDMCAIVRMLHVCCCFVFVFCRCRVSFVSFFANTVLKRVQRLCAGAVPSRAGEAEEGVGEGSARSGGGGEEAQ